MPGKRKKHRVKLVKGRVLYAFEKAIQEIPLELRPRTKPTILARRAYHIYVAEVPSALPRPHFSTFQNLVIGKKTDPALISHLKQAGIVKKPFVRIDRTHLEKILEVVISEEGEKPPRFKALCKHIYTLYCRHLSWKAPVPSWSAFSRMLKTDYCSNKSEVVSEVVEIG